MHRSFFQFAGPTFLLISNLVPIPVAAQNPGTQERAGEIFRRDFSHGVSGFPDIFGPYREQPIVPPRLENSPRLADLIQNGKLELSLGDALALALENNLDIEIQRYLLPIAQTDILRAQSGQAARGFPGARVPSGLNVGALGAGVNAAGGAGGVGQAGGITGGGGAVQVGRSGTFDPTVTFNFSWDRTETPLNTQVVAGAPAVSTQSTAFTGSYTQLFPTGTSYFLSLTGIRQGSDQRFLLFNPAVISRFTAGFNQPLLNGFGLLPNKRFLLVARNNQRVSEDIFRLQLTNVIVTVESLYWDLVALQENLRVAEQALEVANTLLENNQLKVQLGAMARLDVISAQSEVASRQRDVILAQTQLQIQETLLKNALSRRLTPVLDAARIVTTDPLPGVRSSDVPDLQVALATAFENRPDLSQALNNEQNQEITARFTQNGLLPNLSIFGLYAGSGLAGNTDISQEGAGESLKQALTGDFPEYAGGLSLSLPLRNRAAQADDLRAQLENNQLQIATQLVRNQIALEVRRALIQLQQNRAQLEAAREAVVLARETRDAELARLGAGLSTSYQEILRERDLLAAQQAELQVHVNYAKALVEIDRAMGTILEEHGIQFQDAVSGVVSSKPRPSYVLPQPDGGR